ncbi:hypothetical protein DFA_02229 [Cavenderia fasciculata]|uniref:Uncharacterized protein n=1 Tax=Cavenderia fasciculata TaxID=261658 RepID=F4PYV7_CACFS|nr:uncharacterized protein DFA_02229 [Cavenderia fasciculata]EGG18986.1 hypothetical protein DFA_02229 [Cavenderia fasciculata]|eukprot:XP_004357465.1 hypothetical protein DFA_02229 [Cavenderia fasciculata]
MKLTTTIFIIVVALALFSDTVSPQGISHYSQSGGGKPGQVSNYINEINVGGALSSTGKSRYDWSWCRLWIYDAVSQYKAYADFHPRVDEFTSLRIENSNTSIIFNQNVTIWLDFPGTKNVTTFIYDRVTCDNTSAANPEGCKVDPPPEFILTEKNYTVTQNLTLPPKRVYDPDNNAIVNYFTAIVQLDNGNIIDAAWDGDRDTGICNDCEKCIDGQCAVSPNTMKCDETGCNLKIFLAWAGVDKQKKPCISISKIPSAFRKYSFTPISQLGMGLVGDFLERVIGNTNNPNTA